MILELSCGRDSNENYDDLKEIRIGMSIYEVRSIMRNQPKRSWEQRINLIKGEEIVEYGYDTLYVLSYQSMPGSSADYTICFSREDSTVVEIGFGE